jgi:ATP-independent RNA helicase DbpA
MTNKESLIASISTRLKINTLNEMQLAAIKAIEEKNEIILLSATGSGKTLAFLIPLILSLDRISNWFSRSFGSFRELALQIEEVLKDSAGFKIAAAMAT